MNYCMIIEARGRQMKYRLEQDNQGLQTIWVIKKGRKEISHHQSKSDAEKDLQALIEDDAWYSANRD